MKDKCVQNKKEFNGQLVEKKNNKKQILGKRIKQQKGKEKGR